MNIALVFAGGTGQRMKNSAKPKQFLELYGKPIIIYTLEVFEKNNNIDRIVIPCVAGWEDYLAILVEKFKITKVDKILTGGKDTQESKMKALNYLKEICKNDDIIILLESKKFADLRSQQIIVDF